LETVTEHDVPEDPRNDPDHPIPHLNVIDVAAYLKGGGAVLTAIIASPLAADSRSQTRLLDKIQGHLERIQSDEFVRDAGARPTPANTTIRVLLHPDSSGAIRSLLERCRPWVDSHGTTLVVDDLDVRERAGIN
jgi:hypothetical protein